MDEGHDHEDHDQWPPESGPGPTGDSDAANRSTSVSPGQSSGPEDSDTCTELTFPSALTPSIATSPATSAGRHLWEMSSNYFSPGPGTSGTLSPTGSRASIDSYPAAFSAATARWASLKGRILLHHRSQTWSQVRAALRTRS